MKKRTKRQPAVIKNDNKKSNSNTSSASECITFDTGVNTVSNSSSPLDLPGFVTFAIPRLDPRPEYTVKFTSCVESEYNPKKLQRANNVAAGLRGTLHDSDIGSLRTLEEPRMPVEFEDPNQIVIALRRNTHDQLVELAINRSRQVPRRLIKIIGLCIPFHPMLKRISLRWTRLPAASLYEWSKLLSVSAITEMYLDDSPVRERNYRVLLQHEPGLRVLSLARCSLDDEDVGSIATLLAHPLPAARFLNTLNLSMNKIGDRGAFALGKILRSNRSLQCINLAGNQITSEGALCIFKSLMEFPLTSDEMREKWLRVRDFIKRKKNMYERCLADLMPDPYIDPSAKKTIDYKKMISNKRGVNVKMAPSLHAKVAPRLNLRTSPSLPVKMSPTLTSKSKDVQNRAEALTAELIGYLNDPFTSDKTVRRDNITYSFGNMVLSWLNLSYNNLNYESIPILLQVLMYQSSIISKIGTGLLRVQIDGNRLPVQCYEYDCIDDFIEKAHQASSAANDGGGRQPEKVRKLGKKA